MPHNQHIIQLFRTISGKLTVQTLLLATKLHHTRRNNHLTAARHRGQHIHCRLAALRIGIKSVVNNREAAGRFQHQTMLHRRRLRHRPGNLRQPKAQILAHGCRRQNIVNIMPAQQFGMNWLTATLRRMQHKTHTLWRKTNVRGCIIRPRLLQSVSSASNLQAFSPLGNNRVIYIQNGQPVRRQAVNQLKLSGGHVFQTAKGFQMLRANGGDNTNFRLHQIAQFLNITLLPGPHLRHKNLMNGL